MFHSEDDILFLESFIFFFCTHTVELMWLTKKALSLFHLSRRHSNRSNTAFYQTSLSFLCLSFKNKVFLSLYGHLQPTVQLDTDLGGQLVSVSVWAFSVSFPTVKTILMFNLGSNFLWSHARKLATVPWALTAPTLLALSVSALSILWPGAGWWILLSLDRVRIPISPVYSLCAKLTSCLVQPNI